MTLELTRADYCLLGLSSRQCMKLLPQVGLKGLNKVAFGGLDGVLQVFSIKKQEAQVGFKTLPGEPITALQVSGSMGMLQDKIFVASKTEVRGYTKKGKMFLGLDTNMTEDIISMDVIGSDLLVAGSHLYNHYRDCKDVNSYLSSDKINHLVTLPSHKSHRLVSVLACEDRMLRVLDRSVVSEQMPLPSSPVVLGLLYGTGGENGDGVIAALQSGEIAMVNMARGGADWKWTIGNEARRDAVSCMCWYDMYRDGTNQLIVGREDGSLQIYAEPLEPQNPSQPLSQVYNYSCNESITSVQAGNVGNPAFHEVVLTTFTGWFFGLTTEVLEKQVKWENNNMSVKMSTEEKQKIENLRSEIEELERNVIRERERYQMTTREDSIGVATIAPIHINDKLTFLSDVCAYQLSIEAETAIDNVLLQSNVDLKLLDVEKNSAVVSFSQPDPKNSCKLLATYRCQEDVSKMSILFEQGYESGLLNVYITTQTKPKAAHLLQYPIRKLGMLIRTHDTDEISSCNILRLTGSFSQAEMHNWLFQCLPQIPEKMPASPTLQYRYVSPFVGSQLHLNYSKGEAECRSDDVSIISSVKDFLSQQATAKKMKLDIGFELSPESIKTVLGKLYPRMREELQVEKEAVLYEALKDLETVEGDSQFQLTAYCKRILQRGDTTDRKQSKHKLEKIQDYIVRLHADWSKLHDFTKSKQVKEQLKDISFENLLKMFQIFQPSDQDTTKREMGERS